MNSVGENAFLASRRASSCPLKGMFFIGKGHVLERRWVWSPSPNLLRKRVGHLTGQCLLWFYGCELRLTRVARRSNKKGLEGEHGWEKALLQMAEELSTIGGVAW